MPPLTDIEIRRAKPRERPYKLTDGAGMYLYLSPTGARSWRLKYRHRGKEKTLALGLYPTVTLSKARLRRDAARALISDGVDPIEQRRAARAGLTDTFKAVSQEWFDKQAGILASQTLRTVSRHLSAVLYPAIGGMALRDIKPAHLLGVLRRLEERGVAETARRIRSLVGRIFRYAIATGRAEHDISADLRGALASVRVTHHAAITEPRRIGELLRAIDGYQGQPSTQYALRLAAYLFVRPGELRAAQWTEFDLEACEWRIPAARTKMRAEHVVALASQVVALLHELQALTGSGVLVFPSLSSTFRPLSENALNAALRRLGFGKDEMTSHGFRSMASTRLNELGYSPDVIELQLAHAERNKVRASYNKAVRLEERKNMMQAWADYLDGLRAGGRIVAIKRSR